MDSVLLKQKQKSGGRFGQSVGEIETGRGGRVGQSVGEIETGRGGRDRVLVK